MGGVGGKGRKLYLNNNKKNVKKKKNKPNLFAPTKKKKQTMRQHNREHNGENQKTSWFFENIHIIDTTLTGLTKKNKEKKQIARMRRNKAGHITSYTICTTLHII